MSDNFISNVLNILRLVKASAAELHGHPASGFITKWAGAALTEPATLRICAYVQDQCDGALELINQSSHTEEEKAGLCQTVQALRNGFSIQHIQSPLMNQLPQLDASISFFSILQSSINLSSMSSDIDELHILIEEVESLINLFDDPDIDPIVKTTAKKHLHVLLTLLRNVDAFGVDAAMAAYAELVIRLRRVDSSASETARAKVAKIWPIIEKWVGRLAIIDKATNSGQALLEHAHGLSQLIS